MTPLETPKSQKAQPVLEVTVVRHADVSGRNSGSRTLFGQSDVTLTHEGKKQSAAVAWRLRKRHFDRVFCSDLLRCKETCESILSLQKDELLKSLTYDPRLREQKLGQLEQKSWAEVKRILRQERKTYEDYLSQNAEGYGPFEERVLDFYCELVEEYVLRRHYPETPLTSSELLNPADCRPTRRQSSYLSNSLSVPPTFSRHDSNGATKTSSDAIASIWPRRMSAPILSCSRSSDPQPPKIRRRSLAEAMTRVSGFTPVPTSRRRSTQMESIKAIGAESQANPSLNRKEKEDTVRVAISGRYKEPKPNDAEAHAHGPKTPRCRKPSRGGSLSSSRNSSSKAASKCPSILVVTHGGVIQQLFAYLIEELEFEINTDAPRIGFPKASSIYTFSICKTSGKGSPGDVDWFGQIQCVNCVSHLAGLDSWDLMDDGRLKRSTQYTNRLLQRRAVFRERVASFGARHRIGSSGSFTTGGGRWASSLASRVFASRRTAGTVPPPNSTASGGSHLEGASGFVDYYRSTDIQDSFNQAAGGELCASPTAHDEQGGVTKRTKSLGW